MDGTDPSRLELPGGQVGVVAIVRLRDHEPVDELLTALLDGGVRTVEVTLPTPGALAAVRRWTGDDRVVAGVGTIRTQQDALTAAGAGAAFLVTPTTVPEVLAAAARHAVPVVSGALTPTEIDRAWQSGAAAVKVFPVSAVGGASYVRAVREPLDDVLLLPTGGVDDTTAGEFARAGCVGIGAGSALVAERLVAAGDWVALRDRACRFVDSWHAGLGDRA